MTDDATRTTYDELPSWLLSRAQQRSQGILREALDTEGISEHHYRVLSVLEHSEPLPQAEIGLQARMDKGDLSHAVTLLERGGHVERTPDPSDGRRKLLSITDRGRRRAKELGWSMTAIQDRILSPLEEGERAEFLRLLAKLKP
ncbi:MarR family winged helix-turn-helix transcriptional regulator [Brevibacterium litoralis]|uniref:MarR family winged helix-turn-helix transcriptional regulator n=1 Tax=Brevibacterium litoralis TaxID=3138935 RepID=UPI0032ED0090